MKIKLLRNKVFAFLKPAALCLFIYLFLILAASCNKSSGINENKAFVTITHATPGGSPIDVLYNGNSILGGNSLAYNQTTGSPGDPYIEATAGVRELQVTAGGQTILQGNTAFQQGLHYSLFLYDTLKNDSMKMFILQDNLQIRTDTFTYVRFINFSPAYLSLLITGNGDTIATGNLPYAGNKLDPSYYSFRRVPIGNYAVRAFRDTVYANSIPLDSLYIDSTKIYTVFLQGFADSSGDDRLMVKSIRYN
jgi:hypothetical protein